MLLSTDFTGYYKIAQDNETKALLEAYILKYEKEYLVNLLGYELYVLFLADYVLNSGVPTGRYATIYNELNHDPDSGDCVFIPSQYNDSDYAKRYRNRVQQPTLSAGIKTMLKGFIYFEFVNEYGINVGQAGVVAMKDENADANDSKQLALVESRYNDSIKSYQVIQNYIEANLSDYSEYKGKKMSSVHWGGAF
jgi:hypothetical protein